MRRRYPGRVVAYGDRFGGVYQFAFFPLDVREFAHMLFFSSTVKIFGTYLGTDKLGHFTDEGIHYYFTWRGAWDRGLSEKHAIAQAVRLGTQGFWSERGVLGLAANADYSNADLAANFAGFMFYRNLTEMLVLKGRLCPPLLLRDGPCWKLAANVRPDSSFFARFITDHLDEALNPGWFDPLCRPGLRGGVRARSKRLLQHYCDDRGQPRPKQWFDEKLRELSTYGGVDYGHLGKYDELVSIGSECFDAGNGATSGARADPKARLATERLHALRAPPTDEGREPSRRIAPGQRDEFGWTALHDAAAGGDEKLARRLIDGSADPGCADDYGTTPLHVACRHGHLAIAKLLIERGADVNARSAAGATPLHEAAIAPDRQIIRLLLQHGARCCACDVRGRTPADVAAGHGYPDIALELRLASPATGGAR